MLHQVHGVPLETFLSEDDFRLFYAAYDNDVLLMQSLNILEWQVRLPEPWTLLHHCIRLALQSFASFSSFRSGQRYGLRWPNSSWSSRVAGQR
jgi:hypothetical protein